MADEDPDPSQEFLKGPPLLSPMSAAAERLKSSAATQTLLRPHVPPPLSQPLRTDPYVIHYGDKSEQENSKGLITWKQNFRNSNKSGSLYEEVKVLLISWDVSSDDLNTKEEVSASKTFGQWSPTVKQVERLEQLFQDTFKYKVQKVLLTSEGKPPQQQMIHHISDFVWFEDAPRTLLIVYYAGHGSPGQAYGQIHLSG